MRSKLSIGMKVALAVFTVILLAAPSFAAKLKVLHSFSGEQGRQPVGVTFGDDGNLYGATAFGGGPGNGGFGTVFELTPTEAGGWMETRMHIFQGAAGEYPNAGILFDNAGNIYGTMQLGPHGGTGKVYELSADEAGIWHETGIHNLSLDDGLYPEAPLVRDGAGNFYSTAWGGGAYGLGTVFELSPNPGGDWIVTTLHAFGGGDGAVSKSGLMIDVSGDLYGTTVCGGATYTPVPSPFTPETPGMDPDCGGASGAGTIWKLTQQTDGTWTMTTLYSFTGGIDGANPVEPGGLIIDRDGNLYGTTLNGGLFSQGTVFELSPDGAGGWRETVLHSFNEPGGSYPYASLVFDVAGNLYGEAQSGGTRNHGVVFKLSPIDGPSWRYTVLHNFSGPEGSTPRYGLTFGNDGNLYGTTDAGGAQNNGTVFEIIP